MYRITCTCYTNGQSDSKHTHTHTLNLNDASQIIYYRMAGSLFGIDICSMSKKANMKYGGQLQRHKIFKAGNVLFIEELKNVECWMDQGKNVVKKDYYQSRRGLIHGIPFALKLNTVFLIKCFECWNTHAEEFNLCTTSVPHLHCMEIMTSILHVERRECRIFETSNVSMNFNFASTVDGSAFVTLKSTCKWNSMETLFADTFYRKGMWNGWLPNRNESIIFKRHCAPKDAHGHRVQIRNLLNWCIDNTSRSEQIRAEQKDEMKKKRLLIIYITCFYIMKQIFGHPFAGRIADAHKIMIISFLWTVYHRNDLKWVGGMFGADILQEKQIMKINEPFRGDFSTKNENNFLCILQNINLFSVGRCPVCLCASACAKIEAMR